MALKKVQIESIETTSIGAIPLAYMAMSNILIYPRSEHKFLISFFNQSHFLCVKKNGKSKNYYFQN